MEKDEKLRLQTIRQASIRYKQISCGLQQQWLLPCSLPAGYLLNAMI